MMEQSKNRKRTMSLEPISFFQIKVQQLLLNIGIAEHIRVLITLQNAAH
jgi:hypothetical protein